MSCGIYLIENKINGHKYIGQSVAIEQRWQEHKNIAFNKNNVHYNKILYQAFRKYGLENFIFSIIEECNKEQLNEREKYWISYYNTFYGDGYNATLGGELTFKSRELSQEEIQQMWDSGMTAKEIKEYYNCHNMTLQHYLEQCPNYTETESRRRSAKQNALKRQEQGENITIYSKPIIQYDMNGKYIKEFDSLTQITKELGFAIKTIKKCIEEQSISSYNYRWGLKGEELISIEKIKENSHQKYCKINGEKLTWEKANEIKRLLRETSLSQKEIAKQFNITQSQVSCINLGKSWKDTETIYPIRKKFNSKISAS